MRPLCQRLRCQGFNEDGRTTVRPYSRYSSRFDGNGRPPTKHFRVSLQPLLVPMHFDALRGPWHHTSEEIEIASVENGNPPRRHKKILPNFDLLLPKFHFILPNFYFGAPWRIFVSSLEIPDFLPRGEMRGGRCERAGVPLQVAIREICTCPK